MKYIVFLVIYSFLSNSFFDPTAAVYTNEANIDKSYPENVPATLDKYWYQGKAEISRYELQQNRYGDIHTGSVVLIFVTEDFLTDKQVKNDRYQNPNSVPILKTNLIRKFVTGIYDYSMMSSVFTPVDLKKFPHSLKVSSSSQDWCGHTYHQINLEEQQYKSQLHSYFESEADQTIFLPVNFLEDELYNRLRINPRALPTGDIQVIPSTQIMRLMHLEMKAYPAVASRGNYSGTEFTGNELQTYKLEYPTLSRELELIYEAKAPYKIAGWLDTYPSMGGKQLRTTIARKTHERFSAYWKEHNRSDRGLRSSLGLN